MQRQGSFSQAETRRQEEADGGTSSLSEMERVVPWSRLVDWLRPFYPKSVRDRPPIGLERMLRLYFCGNGTGWSRPWGTRSTIARRCAALPASIGGGVPIPKDIRAARGWVANPPRRLGVGLVFRSGC